MTKTMMRRMICTATTAGPRHLRRERQNGFECAWRGGEVGLEVADAEPRRQRPRGQRAYAHDHNDEEDRGRKLLGKGLQCGDGQTAAADPANGHECHDLERVQRFQRVARLQELRHDDGDDERAKHR